MPSLRSASCRTVAAFSSYSRSVGDRLLITSGGLCSTLSGHGDRLLIDDEKGTHSVSTPGRGRLRGARRGRRVLHFATLLADFVQRYQGLVLHFATNHG